MRPHLVLTGLAIVSLAACSVASTGGGPSVAPSAEPGAAATSTTPLAEAGVEAISLAHLTTEAKDVLSQCVRDEDIKLVSGMAKLASAREVPRYGWFGGDEVELMTDVPAWVIQYDGDLSVRGVIYHDPTCVVIDGVRYLFLTGGATDPEGKTMARSERAKAPERTLPPLLP